MMARKVHVCIKNWEFHSSDTSQTSKIAILHSNHPCEVPHNFRFTANHFVVIL
jgi:hypothetical protein